MKAETSAKTDPEMPSSGWSLAVRIVVSILIFSYLTVVVIGPMSNPIGAENLTTPLRKFVAPVHNALFTGHGYRFFGPDPGPSHLLSYKVKKADGVEIGGRFPNRNDNKQWPRLLYHRWFMLSERVYEEHLLTMDEQSHSGTMEALDQRAEELRAAGRIDLANRIVKERQQQAEDYTQTRSRIDSLVSAIAKHLLKTHDGESVELFVQERSIPRPGDVSMGAKLDNKNYLAPASKIFELSNDGQKKSTEEIYPIEPSAGLPLRNPQEVQQ